MKKVINIFLLFIYELKKKIVIEILYVSPHLYHDPFDIEHS